MKRVNLTVESLSCPGCATDVETVLKSEAGIENAAVDYAKNSIVVDFDPAEITEERIFGIIKRIGLKVLQSR